MNHNLAKAKVTIVVVPRERFSLIEKCVEYIYAFTPEPFELIVVDGNSPKLVSEKLKRWQEKNPNMQILRSERFLYPYEAKNLAVKHLSKETEWVVFVDNDVKVSPHWLTWLLEAAQETGARIVHPLYLIEQKGGDISIHMADGVVKKGQKNGREVMQPIMNYVGLNICNSAKFKRRESDFLEFHTFMIHHDVLREMGEFEPLTLSEDVNYSFRLKEKNEKIIFEPRAVITYIAGPPFEPYDLPYFKFRWSEAKGKASIEWLKPRWSVVDGYWGGKLAWMNFHRYRVEPWFPIVAKYRQWYPHSSTVRKIGRIMPFLSKV